MSKVPDVMPADSRRSMCRETLFRKSKRSFFLISLAVVAAIIFFSTATLDFTRLAEDRVRRPSAAPAIGNSSSASFTAELRLRGLVFTESTPLVNATGELEHRITWSSVTSFSPAIENHVKLMIRDRFNECNFQAMGPAMSQWNGRVVANVRVWQSQYLMSALGKGRRPIDSWQENYIYAQELDENYQSLSPGRLLGLPTTTNAYSSYRKDGPMDPRSFVLNGRLYLVYYSYGLETTRDYTAARMYLWDYANSIKVKLFVSGMTLQKISDINWVPIIVNNELFFVYSFDPLRILKCNPDSGECVRVFSQVRDGQHPFSKEWDHLRGGTPFVEYEHPYYLGVAHSAAMTTNGWTIYHTNLVVLSVEPWRLVYVSEHIAANESWMSSVPIVTAAYVRFPFWYPTALILRDGDTADVGCHLNDYSSHVVRIGGLGRLMTDVIRADSTRNPFRKSARSRAVQQYILECYKRYVYSLGQWFWFQGDFRKY